MLLPYTTLEYYGPDAVSMSLADGIGVGSMEASARQDMRVALSVVGTGDAPLLRPYRGYAAALSVAGDSFVDITPHQLMKVKLTVNVGAVPSAEDIAQAIWNSQASSYNASNTMGNRLNAAGSGGVDYTALGIAVWESVARTMTSAGNNAIAAAVAAEATTTPFAANIKQFNSNPISGTGQAGDPVTAL